jgi:hypothetical protein
MSVKVRIGVVRQVRRGRVRWSWVGFSKAGLVWLGFVSPGGVRQVRRG